MRKKPPTKTIPGELLKLFFKAAEAGDFASAARIAGELRALGVLTADEGKDSPREAVEVQGIPRCPSCGQRLERAPVVFRVIYEDAPGVTLGDAEEKPALPPGDNGSKFSVDDTEV